MVNSSMAMAWHGTQCQRCHQGRSHAGPLWGGAYPEHGDGGASTGDTADGNDVDDNTRGGAGLHMGMWAEGTTVPARGEAFGGQVCCWGGVRENTLQEGQERTGREVCGEVQVQSILGQEQGEGREHWEQRMPCVLSHADWPSLQAWHSGLACLEMGGGMGGGLGLGKTTGDLGEVNGQWPRPRVVALAWVWL